MPPAARAAGRWSAADDPTELSDASCSDASLDVVHELLIRQRRAKLHAEAPSAPQPLTLGERRADAGSEVDRASRRELSGGA